MLVVVPGLNNGPECSPCRTFRLEISVLVYARNRALSALKLVRLVGEGSREVKPRIEKGEDHGGGDGRDATAELLHGESGMQDVTARAWNVSGTMCILTHLYKDIIQNIQEYTRYIHRYIWLSSREASDARDQLGSSFSTSLHLWNTKGTMKHEAEQKPTTKSILCA